MENQKRPKVYVTRELPNDTLNVIRDRCDVDMNTDYKSKPKNELIEKFKKYDALLVVGTKIDEEICAAIKDTCKIIANYGVGYDNIDVEAATKHGIYVTNNPDRVTDATADLTWTLLLSTARRIVECDRHVRSGEKSWGPNLLIGSHVSGKTLGIIGAGRIGTAVGKRAKGFDMKIIYTSTKPNKEFEDLTGGIFMDKEQLLQEADFITIHTPFLPSTFHLLGENEFNLMKKTAIVINASRGKVIDEKALVSALQNKEIAGAGLDVYEKEPYLQEGLDELSNVVLTPHVGTSTIDTRFSMAEGCAINIFAALEGKLPPNLVNPEVSKK